jgi:hypothetical protein
MCLWITGKEAKKEAKYGNEPELNKCQCDREAVDFKYLLRHIITGCTASIPKQTENHNVQIL